jgi:hypothetical protein
LLCLGANKKQKIKVWLRQGSKVKTTKFTESHGEIDHLYLLPVHVPQYVKEEFL